jgi:hypothetical protein
LKFNAKIVDESMFAESIIWMAVFQAGINALL